MQFLDTIHASFYMATVGVAWDCVFNAVPLFVSRQTSSYISLYIVIYIMEITGFFLLMYHSDTPLPYVGVSVTPVTHMQAGNPYGLLEKPITKVIGQKLVSL